QAGFNLGLTPNNQRPAHGSIIARKLGPRGGVPPYVCLPRMHPSGGPAYLGSTAAPFVIDADPNAPGFSVPDLVPPPVLAAARLEMRHEPLREVDLLPALDSALATLFRDLADRGLLETTLVIVTGEFGRTPRINGNAGRDHWGPAFTVALGGGGIQGGRVVGATDARAERPAGDPH